MRRVLKQAVRDGVLEALELLVDVALVLKKHCCGRLSSVSVVTAVEYREADLGRPR